MKQGVSRVGTRTGWRRALRAPVVLATLVILVLIAAAASADFTSGKYDSALLGVVGVGGLTALLVSLERRYEASPQTRAIAVVDDRRARRYGGWFDDPYGLGDLRWWDGEHWTEWSATRVGEAGYQTHTDSVVAESQRRADERARAERRDARRRRSLITVWLVLVVLGALGMVVPTAMAQQDFGRFLPGTSTCAPEPWHVNESGMRTFFLCWAGLMAIAVVGVLVFRRRRSPVAGDPRARTMLAVGVVVSASGPIIWWGVLYVLAGANCGL